MTAEEITFERQNVFARERGEFERSQTVVNRKTGWYNTVTIKLLIIFRNTVG